MSYHDPDQLPFGVSPSDATGMGISPWDSQSAAVDKFNTALVTQGLESHANFMREMDAALHPGAPAGVVTGAHGVSNHAPNSLSQLMRQLGPGKITDTKSLASFIETKQGKLKRTRLESTRGLKRAAVAAWLLAGLLLVAVLFHIQFFNATYRHVTYEYFVVRVGLLAALFCGWKCTSMVRRAFTEAEKECPLQLAALRQALGQARAKDWRRALNREYLTPLFIHDFNAHFKQKTGKDLPYLVYRYNEMFDQQLCLVPDASNLNDVDRQHGKIIAPEDVRAMTLAQA